MPIWHFKSSNSCVVNGTRNRTGTVAFHCPNEVSDFDTIEFSQVRIQHDVFATYHVDMGSNTLDGDDALTLGIGHLSTAPKRREPVNRTSGATVALGEHLEEPFGPNQFRLCFLDHQAEAVIGGWPGRGVRTQQNVRVNPDGCV